MRRHSGEARSELEPEEEAAAVLAALAALAAQSAHAGRTGVARSDRQTRRSRWGAPVVGVGVVAPSVDGWWASGLPRGSGR
ncbi:hypothetical protein [Nakamurella aerolata]|uniref:Uncharacterized protein n=1 Tax=Nakamurella aerolata TaxID=1656892 RepID=A0A849A902_9ACTN|nr:hypothetical protein [Nakamurella aerolata]NNG36033.1 hypothetical protein [Nakamurella aerolata]